MALPAATLSHAGPWVYVLLSCIASILLSHAALGPSPALSTLPEAHTLLLPPTARHAAAPSCHGSWASAPLPREGIYSPPLSPCLSAPACMPSTVQAAPSLVDSPGSLVVIPPSEDGLHSSLPPLALPLHVKPTSLDHGEVASTSQRSHHVSQGIPPDTSYILSPKTPCSTFIAVDISWDSSSSILNRTNSPLSIQIQCDSDTKLESSSQDLSKFDNDLKAAIATLSLPQQSEESDIALSHHQDACACLALGSSSIQDVVPAPVTKYEDISLHSARFNRGRALAMPLKDASTDSPIRQPQSAFIKHDIKPLTCEPKRFLPQGSIEVNLQPKSSAPIQHEEGIPLKKSESSAFPQEESAHQQASMA